jgi:WD40 repeat protein
LRTLKGHSAGVNAVAVTADGRRAVSASPDTTLKVWDVETGRALLILEGHSAAVSGVAVTANGKRAVSASRDKTLKVWDMETGRALLTLEGHAYGVTGVAVTTDGKRAVSASSDKTLKVWDVETGRELLMLESHSDAVRCVAETADGKRAVSASSDNTLKVWDMETGRGLLTLGSTPAFQPRNTRRPLMLEGHSFPVRGVAMTADGKRAISASWDNTLRVWDVETGSTVITFYCDAAALCCTFADDRTIVGGDASGHVLFLRLEE